MNRDARTLPLVHNNTPFTRQEIEQFVYLGFTKNNWRGRNVSLYQHPTEPDLLVSVGTTYDQRMTVLAVEPKSSFKIALGYAAHGKIYVSE